MTEPINGACFCGAITYRIDGPLIKARSCHCSRCRKAFSAQASAYARVNPGTFRWTSGEDGLRTYASQEGFGLQFCGTCGSTLCGTWQGEVHGVTLGCLNGDPPVEIGMHIWVGSKAGWEKLPEGIEVWQEGPPDSADL